MAGGDLGAGRRGVARYRGDGAAKVLAGDKNAAAGDELVKALLALTESDDERVRLSRTRWERRWWRSRAGRVSMGGSARVGAGFRR